MELNDVYNRMVAGFDQAEAVSQKIDQAGEEAAEGWRLVNDLIVRHDKPTQTLVGTDPYETIERAKDHATKANQISNTVQARTLRMAGIITSALVGDDRGAPRASTDPLNWSLGHLRREIGKNVNKLPDAVLVVGARAVEAYNALPANGWILQAELEEACHSFVQCSQQAGATIGQIKEARTQINNYLSRLKLPRID